MYHSILLCCAQVLPFVTGHISSGDWHYREGATYAFGSIMDGPSPASLDQFVRGGLPFMMNALKDQHRLVRVSRFLK